MSGATDALVDFHTGSYYHATDERGHPKAFRRGGRAHPIFSPHRAKVLHGPARGATLDAAHFVHFNGRYGCGAAESAGCVLYEALRASPAVARLEAVLKTLPPLPIPAQAPVSPVTPRPTLAKNSGPWAPDEVRRFDAAFKRFYNDGLPDWSGRAAAYVGTRDKYQVQTFKRARVKQKDPY